VTTRTPPVWDGDVLHLDGAPRATVDPGTDLPVVASPRPFLHPVRTPSGVLVTDSAPADHLHHHGVGLAVPDVDGTSHWGGRTYVRGTGSTLLANHGAQRTVATRREGGTRHDDVEWSDEASRVQLRERRTLRAVAAGTGTPGWVLRWRSVLVPERDLTVGSPATNGRAGAFYGGWFWRTPFTAAAVEVEEGPGTDRAHGSTSRWLSVQGPDAHLLAVQRGTPRPWFVRSEGYVGFGPALAHHDRLALRAGVPFEVAVDVLVADGPAPAGAARGALAADLDALDGGAW